MEALVARALSRTYHGRRGIVRALDGVDMTIAKGRLFGFLGRNGAGKTTFIKIATALLMPTAGTVELFGLNVVEHAREVREQIALVPQEGKPFYHLTPREHVEEYLRVRGATAETAKTRADEVLAGMGLQSYQDVPAMVLSGGLQQRTLVAMVLATEAPFLFLDEPTLGMDPFARRQVWEVIRRAARKGSTVLLTTHYLDEAEQLSEELSVIEGGHVLYQGSSEALKSKVRREVRLHFAGGFTAPELAAYGEVYTERSGVILLTTRDHVEELLRRALERKIAVNVGPVTLEEAFLTLVGRAIEEEDAEEAVA
ncbi:MAG TPA: ABC transporter ATP-binding protein [Thermoplasmata archaeon]|nr:ABC transporter ATP-binding protein [Thermoplasmata archaeon]